MMAAVTSSMRDRTGRTLEEWVKAVRTSGVDPLDQNEVRKWLKAEHGVPQNSQWAIAFETAEQSGWVEPTVEQYIDQQYSGPKAEIAAVVKGFDGVLLVVDTVSSFSAVPTPVDELGIDVLLAGVQKALALPPGLSIFTASEAALARAEGTPNRGYYFDFLEFARNDAKNNTPSTPAIALLYALREKVESILAEGLPARYERHESTKAQVHAWGDKHGIDNFAPAGFQSKSLTCFATPEDLDLPAFIKELRSRHNFLINGGYGKIKGKTFRISNMGNETAETMDELIAALDDVLPGFRS